MHHNPQLLPYFATPSKIIFITEVAGPRSHTRLQTRGPSLPQLHVLVALRVGNTDSRGLEMHLNMQWMN